jgi:hypothetical protein
MPPTETYYYRMVYKLSHCLQFNRHLTVSYCMQKLTHFFWLCSGADIAILQKCTTEKSKYAGIGATVFFTGLFAALAGGYALYTVFDNAWIAAACGLLWGLLIFNLDRYIVSSMRKNGKFLNDFTMALPRMILAVIISIVIAKPLELKIFQKEIDAELIVMDQEMKARQEDKVKARFSFEQDSLKQEIQILKNEILTKTAYRDDLLRIAREEADGTGGSKKKNLGPIYKIKKANADAAESEVVLLAQHNNQKILALENKVNENDTYYRSELAQLKLEKTDGPAARIEAMKRLTEQYSAMWWAELFIILLFIALETSPVIVKLISPKGPYDNLLRVEEHKHLAMEVEEVARTNAEIKSRNANLPGTERDYLNRELDSALG